MNPADFLPQNELVHPIVSGPDQGRAVAVMRGRMLFKVAPEETGGAYAVVEQIVEPGDGPPLHRHHHETELFYVVDGHFEFTIADQRVQALPGTLVAGPRGIAHTFRNVGDQPGKLLLTILPGNFANFFVEVDGSHDPDVIHDLAAKYGVEILA